MPPIAVIDFETTGLSAAMGDRATEVAIVLLEGTRVVDRFDRRFWDAELARTGARPSPPFAYPLLVKVQRTPRKSVPKAIRSFFEALR
jgi:DNA polymerase III epsilon subunit-like protein